MCVCVYVCLSLSLSSHFRRIDVNFFFQLQLQEYVAAREREKGKENRGENQRVNLTVVPLFRDVHVGVVLARLYLVSSFRSCQITARPSATTKSATAIAKRDVRHYTYAHCAISCALSASLPPKKNDKSANLFSVILFTFFRSLS